MNAECLADAGSKAIGLYQSGNQCADIVYAGALDEVSQGLSPGLARPHFEVHQIKLVAEIRVGVSQVFSDPHQSLVKCQAHLYADYGKVQGVRQCEGDAPLPVADHALEHKTRDEEAKSPYSDHQE